MPSILDKIAELSSLLKGMMPIKDEFQANLDKKFRLEFNYNSNHLEGNTLTYSETALLLIFDDTKGNHTLREYEEMKAHDVASRLVNEWAFDEENPLTEARIKNLNKIILVRPFWKDAITPDGHDTRKLINVGDYKTTTNHVQLANGEIFKYASVSDTPIFMGELIEWYRNEEQKNELHPVALAALLHYKFVRIHPFDDGNGRISRLLMNYVLLKNNLPPVVIKSTDKKNYLLALNSADAGDINAFIEYVAGQLVWSLELTIKAANGESVEEENDLEKEISIWKKQAKLNVVSIRHRNDDLVNEVYTKMIREIFEQFIGSYGQFNELFQNADYFSYINNKGQQGIKWLDMEVNKIVSKPRIPFYKHHGQEPVIENDSFRNMWIQANFVEYQFNIDNPFTINPRLMFEFLPYKYEIRYANKVIEKNYSDFLDGEERTKIIADSIKAVFAEIKERSVLGKL